jgi:VWFA-related protein
MRIRSAAIVASAALWAAPALTAPSPQNPPQPPPVFRGGTDLVEVDVVVHGKDGAFVSDLSAADFVVEEGGVAQPIQQFYLRLATHATWATAPAAAGGASTTSPDAVGTAVPPQRVFVVVFDDEHLTPSGFKRTQAAAQLLFTQQFRSGDAGGVVTRGQVANNRLTTNREDLLKAVKDAKPNTTKNSRLFDERQWPRLTESEAVRITFNNDRVVLEEAIRRACNDDPELCKRVDPEPSVRSKASVLADTARAESARTLRTLATLTAGLANVPGRKTIVLMSEGFLAEDEWPLVAETVTLAARANARIYTLDARGLERGLSSVFDSAPADSGTRLLEQMDFGADSINSLAVDSGGFVVRNTNLFDRAIARIADDAGNYYVLGIRPSAQPDGKFHPIRVKVARPGVSVRARRGYVAVPRPAAKETMTAGRDEPAAAAPEPAVNIEEPSPVVAPAVEALPVEGTRVARAAPAATGLRVRPDADTHATTLAAGRAPRDPDATAGWEAYQRGDVETARERLAVAAARSTADAWVHYTLGMSDYALRRFREAAVAWEHVRSAAPDFEPVYFDLVDAYLQQKEHDAAIRIARVALGRWPRDPELSNALGVIQTARGSLDDAVKSFQSAVAVAPSDATGYFNLGKALELRYFRTRRYVQQFRRWVSNESDRTDAAQNYEHYIALGGVYSDAAREGLVRLKWVAK